MLNGPELVDDLDGTEYVLTAPRCQVTWEVQKGNRMAVERKRVRQGEVIKGVPEYNLRRLVDLGHAVPKDEYDPQKLVAEKMRKRLIYDQGAVSTAAIEFALAKNRKAQAVGGNVGLEDADAPAKTTDSGLTVDGIKVEDVDMGSDSPKDDDDELTSTEGAGAGEGEDEGDGSTEPEDYRSMDYPRLQQYAKQVTGSGAGGKEEIVARLDDHFAK